MALPNTQVRTGETMQARTMPKRFGPDAILITFALAAIGVELVAILITTQGHFTYSLDDPYIHLRLSEQIFHGTYGINTGEPSSPSSSILWPFLLAPFTPTPLHPYIPLLINSLAFTGSLLVARRILPVRPGVIIAIALVLNWVGLVFTGMEHSLQVLLTLLCAQGILQAWRGEPITRWFWVAAVLGPSIRYENLAVTLVALVAVGAMGHARRSAAAAAAALAPIIGFSIFLHALGLPWLPDSVIAKRPLASTHSISVAMSTAGTRLANNLVNGTTVGVLMLALLAFVIMAVRRVAKGQAPTRSLIPVVGALAVLAAHIGFAANGWFGRYEIYTLSFALFLVLGSEHEWIQRATAWLGAWSAPATFLTTSLLVTPTLLFPTLTTPEAALGIYSKQVQLHRLAVDFLHGPVAVNNLGAVSYQSPYRVVDLWGLGSNRALKLRHSGRQDWMATAVPVGSVKAVMIYPSWFTGQIPANWPLVGCLRHDMLSSAGPNVAIYATAPKDAESLHRAMAAWAPSIPSGAHVLFTGCS